MVFATPPPLLGVTTVFPELGPLARPAVRLHPRAGAPDADDSSLGGPLLWPADEPWPVCHGRLLDEWRERIVPEDFQRFRDGQIGDEAELDRIVAGAGSIDMITGERVFLLPRPHQLPPPLIAVMQLYARDVPELPFPEDTDLFQLLWCPNWHAAPWYGPHPVTVWRTAARVGRRLAELPAPRFDGLDRDLAPDDYVPRPCVVHPEPVIEYPDPEDLPDGLAERVRQCDEESGGRYWAELSTAPGSKVGGHPSWIQSPEWPTCRCGRRMDHLLTIASGEFGSEGRWTRFMNCGLWAPHGIKLGGGGGSLYLFTCTACAERPLAGVLQR
jgi:hypothetical protein